MSIHLRSGFMTKEQERDLLENMEVWSLYETSTDPAERVAGESAILHAYRQIGLGPPRMSWCSSPLSMTISRATLELLGGMQVDGSEKPGAAIKAPWSESFMGRGLKRPIRDEILLEAEDNLEQMLGQGVLESLCELTTSDGWSASTMSSRAWGTSRNTRNNQIRWGNSRIFRGGGSSLDVDQLMALFTRSIDLVLRSRSIPDTVLSEAFASAESLLGRPITDEEREMMMQYCHYQNLGRFVELVQSSLVDACYGQFDARFLAVPDFLRNEMDFEAATERLLPLMAIVRTGAAFVPHERYCWLYERLGSLKLDESRRPHCEDGACITFADGFEVYAWHGMAVSRRLVMEPETITIKEIEKEKNVEVRRILISRFGEQRFITESGAEIIDEDPRYGTLYLKRLTGDFPIVMVKVLNATPERDGSFKAYFIRVPPEVSSARQAVAWSFDMSETDYDPVEES
ncbi:MAG: DUF6745 domain-containing protein [Candidatus Obscuribacterales bacterium]